MKAAAKTVEFVKQWINGTYTKRQYQNYYIVKTPHAQFLMKSTENRELLAIRDNTGHVYVLDDELAISTSRTPVIYENDAMGNPLIVLISEDYNFAHTRLSPASIQRTKKDIPHDISKWKTLDRVEVKNDSLPVPIYLSLVEIGDFKYYIYPNMQVTVSNNYTASLHEWVNHFIEIYHKFPHKWVSYNIVNINSSNINTVKDVKERYLTFAGVHASRALVNYDTWIIIPTDHTSIEEITGRPFREAKRTRPNPYAFGITSNIVAVSKLYRRNRTLNEDTDQLRDIFNIRDIYDWSDWSSVFRHAYLPEVAEDLIAYFTADDAWLQEHCDIVTSDLMAYEFKSKVPVILPSSRDAILYVNVEQNPSPIGEHVVYCKSESDIVATGNEHKFVKLLPTPSAIYQIRSIFDGYN